MTTEFNGIKNTLENSNITINILGGSGELIDALGNLLERIEKYIGTSALKCCNLISGISKFKEKNPNLTQEKFDEMLQQSEIALSVIEDLKLRSTEETQEIRARILAKEYENPNSISARTFEEIKKLSTTQFLWFENEIAPFCDKTGMIFTKQNPETNLMYGYNLVLLNFYARGVRRIIENHYTMNIEFYNNNSIDLSNNKYNNMCSKRSELTIFGRELLQICEPKQWDESYIENLKLQLKNFGIQKEHYKINICKQN